MGSKIRIHIPELVSHKVNYTLISKTGILVSFDNLFHVKDINYECLYVKNKIFIKTLEGLRNQLSCNGIVIMPL